MKAIFTIILLQCLLLVQAQSTYIKLLKIDNGYQGANQVEFYNDNLFVSYYHVDTTRTKYYGGILKMDQNANVIRKSRFIDFDNNLNSILLDRVDEKLYFIGENFGLTGTAPQSIIVYQCDINNLDSLTSVEVIDSNRIYPIIYQNHALIHNDQLILAGSGTIDNKTNIMTAYLDKSTLEVDTITHIGNGFGSIAARSMYIDKDGYLAYHGKFYNIGDTSAIIRVDTENKSIVQAIKYDDAYCYGAWPNGCQLSDGRTVYNRCSAEDSSLPEIVFLADSTYEIVDKFEWTKNLPWYSPNFSRHGRRTYKLIEAHNGDIIGIGAIFWNEAPIPKPHFLGDAPLIFRINNKGDLLWYKAFYNLSEINDGAHGNLYGVTELLDGSIMAVGDIDSDIAFDSILGRPASEPDILIVRMTADGCIEGYDCESLLYKVPEVTRLTTGTQDSDAHDESKIGIYIYPNPANDKLSINIPTNADVSTTQMTVEIFNSLGSIVMKQGLVESQNSVDISALSTGLHIIKIKNIYRTLVTSKFIKL